MKGALNFYRNVKKIIRIKKNNKNLQNLIKRSYLTKMNKASLNKKNISKNSDNTLDKLRKKQIKNSFYAPIKKNLNRKKKFKINQRKLNLKIFFLRMRPFIKRNNLSDFYLKKFAYHSFLNYLCFHKRAKYIIEQNEEKILKKIPFIKLKSKIKNKNSNEKLRKLLLKHYLKKNFVQIARIKKLSKALSNFTDAKRKFWDFYLLMKLKLIKKAKIYEDKNKKKIFKQFMRNSILSNRNRKADKGKIRKVILKNSLKRLMINALKKLKGEILKENEKKFLIYKAYKAIQNSKTKNKTENSVKSSNVNDSQSVNNEELNKKVKAFKEANKSKTYLQFFNSCLQKSVLHKNKDKIEIIKENNKKKKIKEVFQELRIETKRSLLKKKNKQKLDSEFFNLIIKRKSLYILKDAVITKIFYTELYHGFLNQYLIKSNLRKKTVYLQVVLALNALKKYKRKRKPKKKENVKVNNFIQKEDKKENKQKEDSKISVEEEDNKELIEKETLFKHIVYWRFFKDNVIRARQETLNNLQLKRKIFNALKENMKNSKDLAYYLDEAEANDI